ncbi:MAG: putative DNA binding domain-containing protein [Kiritimatiellae bacterium]|nr:putative DNA binding domain-containing protein [Kiritimatiellia bacterium]
MTGPELHALIERLRAEPQETEWLEFKANRYEPQEIGEYLSALANAAAVHGKPKGYLVFGIQDVTHAVVGTDFNPEHAKAKGNQPLLIWLAVGLQPNVGFEHFVGTVGGKHVVLFTVNPAFDRPVKFYGEAFIRVGSSKTALSKHPEKERAIWSRRADWTAQLCERATLDDLDPAAIEKARREYKVKFPAKAADLEGWDDATFLNKAKVTIRGQITHAALILLGKDESSPLLSPAVSRLSWFLKDAGNREQDYEHFGPPAILWAGNLAGKVRNLTVRALPSGTLFPVELLQYDTWVLREALHNCIAHQDYGMNARINVVEFPDRLVFTNQGSFLPGSVESVILQDSPPEVYRNPFLAEAMVNLNMIDTQGGGIKRMFTTQAKRFFPMPDYDLSDPGRVVVTIRGRILDERYTRLLMERADLDLMSVVLLDKIQKGIRIEKDDAVRLRRAGLIEGRFPNLVVSGKIAAVTGDQAQHIRKRGFDNRYYRDLLLELIREHGPVSPEVINELFMEKLPDVLTDEQKRAKIRNLTFDLAHRRGLIQNTGSARGKGARWSIRRPQTNREQK